MLTLKIHKKNWVFTKCKQIVAFFLVAYKDFTEEKHFKGYKHLKIKWPQLVQRGANCEDALAKAKCEKQTMDNKNSGNYRDINQLNIQSNLILRG